MGGSDLRRGRIIEQDYRRVLAGYETQVPRLVMALEDAACSPRQTLAVLLTCDGLPDRKVAWELRTSPRCVRDELRAAVRKLDRNMPQVRREAHRFGADVLAVMRAGPVRTPEDGTRPRTGNRESLRARVVAPEDLVQGTHGFLTALAHHLCNAADPAACERAVPASPRD